MTESAIAHRTSNLPVAVDAMGGDNGPRPVVEGAVRAWRELDIPSVLVGEQTVLRQTLRELGASDASGISIHHASEVITMEDSPAVAIRGKADSSIRVAFELVKRREAASVVSPGNTGAMMAAGLFVSGTMPGIARPAIASLIPKVGDLPPTVMLDSGANVDCHAYQLVQFALMGHYYATSVVGRESPRIALLSNGSEMSKGTDLIRSAALMLSELPGINFIGYVEGRDIPKDRADVIVCDGFLGNIMLKAMEGTAELVFDSIKHFVEKSPRGMIGMWLAKPALKALFQSKLDPSAYGGAPLLGLNDIGIVCHGASNSKAIMNGIRVARKFDTDALVVRMRGALTALDVKMPGEFQDGIWDRMGQRFDKKRKAGAGPARPAEGEPKTDE